MAIIFKDFFTTSEFEDVWRTLNSYYREPESLKGVYKRLFYTIRNLPVVEVHANHSLRLFYDFEGMIHVAGAPDPIEWMVGRPVYFDDDNDIIEKLNMSDVAAHLLYWSTLYSFKTQTRYHKDCLKSWEDGMNGVYKYEVPDESLVLSLKRKRAYYWKESAANDSAIDWRYILDFIRKRIEYHIGYHRYTDRFVNSKLYVSRMELCCRLLNLAAADYYDMDSVYVNANNANRFVGRIFDKFAYDELLDGKTDELILSELRRAKAYTILWKFLEHNLTLWWD